jgi:hypothetical protein
MSSGKVVCGSWKIRLGGALQGRRVVLIGVSRLCVGGLAVRGVSRLNSQSGRAVTCCEWIKRQRLMCESRCPIVTTGLPEECPRSVQVSVCFDLRVRCAALIVSLGVMQLSKGNGSDRTKRVLQVLVSRKKTD